MTPLPPTARPNPPPPALRCRRSAAEIPADVAALLQSRCSQCHTYGERDTAGWGSVLDLSRMVAADIVVPGNPESSRLYQRVAVRVDMPLNGTRLSPEEVGLLRNWISGMGRPFKQPRTNEQILDVIAADNDRIFFSDPDPNQTEADQFRYLSIAHFADEGRSAAEIKAAESVAAAGDELAVQPPADRQAAGRRPGPHHLPLQPHRPGLDQRRTGTTW